MNSNDFTIINTQQFSFDLRENLSQVDSFECYVHMSMIILKLIFNVYETLRIFLQCPI